MTEINIVWNEEWKALSLNSSAGKLCKPWLRHWWEILNRKCRTTSCQNNRSFSQCNLLYFTRAWWWYSITRTLDIFLPFSGKIYIPHCFKISHAKVHVCNSNGNSNSILKAALVFLYRFYNILYKANYSFSGCSIEIFMLCIVS